jgi:hypothetical protein
MIIYSKSFTIKIFNISNYNIKNFQKLNKKVNFADKKTYIDEDRGTYVDLNRVTKFFGT